MNNGNIKKALEELFLNHTFTYSFVTGELNPECKKVVPVPDKEIVVKGAFGFTRKQIEGAVSLYAVSNMEELIRDERFLSAQLKGSDLYLNVVDVFNGIQYQINSAIQSCEGRISTGADITEAFKWLNEEVEKIFAGEEIYEVN